MPEFIYQEQEQVGGLQGIFQGIMGFKTGQIKLLTEIIQTVGTGLVTAAVYWLVTDSLRPAFLWGVIGYFLLYIVIFGFYQLLFAYNSKVLRTK